MPATRVAHDPNMWVDQSGLLHFAKFEREGSVQTAQVHLYAQQRRHQAAYLS